MTAKRRSRLTIFRLGACAAICLGATDPGIAQVTTNVTPDASLTTPSVVTPVGAEMEVTGGTRPNNGANLFHSFSTFNIATGDTVNFLNDTLLATDNIISRVTGDSPSSIFGTIKTTDFGNARLFLLNPAGMMFGPNAQVNVPGAFYASTADFISFSDGARFYADLGQGSTLTFAAPSDFGFINPNPASIQVQGLTAQSPGSIFNIIAGQRDPGSGLDTGITISGDLQGPSFTQSLGALNVVGVGSLAAGAAEGTVAIDNLSVSEGDFARLGKVTLDNAFINVNGGAAGSVYIRAGEFVMDASTIVARTVDGDGGDIEVRAQNILLDGDVASETESNISVSTFGGGDAGNIILSADESLLVQGAELFSFADAGAGGGGDILLTADNIVIQPSPDDTTGVLSPWLWTRTNDSGLGGNVTLTATSSITMGEGRALEVVDGWVTNSRGPKIWASAGSSTTSEAAAGEITLSAPNITLMPMTWIDTGTDGDGQGGDILLDASNVLSVQGASLLSRAGSGVGPSSGNGGNIILRGRMIDLGNGLIAGGAVTKGLNITADAWIWSDGNSGNIDVAASQRINVTGGQFDVATLGPGNAGSILFSAPTINVEGSDGARPYFEARSIVVVPAPGSTGSGNDPENLGNAGSISFSATDSISVTHATFDSQTTGSGLGGSVSFSAPNVIINSASIFATTAGNSRGGDILINASNQALLGGVGLYASTRGDGDAGNISISGDVVKMFDTRADAATTGAGNAGDVEITADELEVNYFAQITTSTSSSGDAGSISILADGAVVLGNGSEIASASETSTSGSAGSIDITTPSLTLSNGGQILATTASDNIDNTPASITITAADEVLLTSGGIIASTTGASSAGSITVDTTNLSMEEYAGIIANTEGAGDAGAITLNAAGAMSVVGGSSILSGSASGSTGSAGSINITTPSFTMSNGVIAAQQLSDNTGNTPASITIMAADEVLLTSGGIYASTGGASSAGGITVDTTNLSMEEGASISASTYGSADSGSITLNAAGAMSIDGGSSVVSGSASGPTGSAGSIDITTPSLTLSGGGQIRARTHSDNTGNTRGTITITAADEVLLTGEGSGLIVTTSGNSDAGDISVDTTTLTISDLAFITASTSGAGEAGSITLNATGAMWIDGGSVVESASETSVSGSAGSIDITTPILTLSGGLSSPGGQILATTASDNTENTPASITINAGDQVLMSGYGSSISATTTAASDAGAIQITTGDLMMDQSIIETFTSGSGAAGSLDIDASGVVTLARRSEIYSDSRSVDGGAAGNVSINASRLDMTGGTSISAETLSDKTDNTPASVIIVADDGVTLSGDGTTITVESKGASSAGNITVDTTTFSLDTNAYLLASALGEGDAGTISLFADTAVVLSRDSYILSSSFNSASGSAGNIIIDTPSLQILGGSKVEASTASDNTGNAPASIIITAEDEVVIAGDPRWGGETGLFVTTTGASAAGDISVDTTTLTLVGGLDCGYCPAVISASTSGGGEAGSVVLNAAGALSIGDGSVVESASLNSASGSSGNIDITTPSLSLSGGQVAVTTASDNTNNTPASITVTAADEVLLTGEGSGILAATSGASSAGGITVNTASLRLDNLASMNASTSGAGDAGSISLLADTSIVLDTGSVIESASLNSASGSPGSIEITTPSLTLSGGGQILATTASDNTDNTPASITVAASDAVLLTGEGSGIVAATSGASSAGGIAVDTTNLGMDDLATINASTSGAGDAGSITLNASGSMSVGSGSEIASASEASTSGSAGSINIMTPSLTLSGGGQILATTASDNTDNMPASITITAADEVLLTGEESGLAVTTSGASDAGGIFVDTMNLTLDDLAVISASTSGAGNAGSIVLNATGALSVGGASVIESASLNSSSGSAGSVDITTPSLTLSGGGQVVATTASDNTDNTAASITVTAADGVLLNGDGSGLAVTTSGASDAGGITVDTTALNLDDLAQVSASTSGAGSAGFVTVVADQVAIDNGAQIASTSTSSGNGGSISVTTDFLDIYNDGRITATSTGNGNAGSIDLATTELGLYFGGTIETSSEESAGGNISIQVDDFAYILGGVISASANGVTPEDNGGNVSLGRPEFLILNNGVIRANANAGNGGNISLAAETFVASADSVIDASSNSGIDGQVTIDAPNNIVGSVVDLEAAFVTSGDLLSDRCAAVALGDRSSFIVENVNPLPPAPGSYVSSVRSGSSMGEASSSIDDFGVTRLVARSDNPEWLKFVCGLTAGRR